MTYDEAKYFSERLVAKLQPYTDKIRVCGSLRRKKETIKDIDIVLIPKREPIKDLFGNIESYKPIPEFVTLINSWEKVKGEPTGKYTKRIVDGVTVEISMAILSNFGNLELIRTGDAEFSHLIMHRLNKMGFEHKDGFLSRDGKIIPLFDEKEFFNTLMLPYIEPEMRTKDIFKLIREVK